LSRELIVKIPDIILQARMAGVFSPRRLPYTSTGSRQVKIEGNRFIVRWSKLKDVLLNLLPLYWAAWPADIRE